MEPLVLDDAADAPASIADDVTELVDLRCGKSDWGVECMIICAQNGHPCPPGVKHTKTGEMGKLYRCAGCEGDRQCWYAYSNDGVCVLRPELKSKLLCL